MRAGERREVEVKREKRKFEELSSQSGGSASKFFAQFSLPTVKKRAVRSNEVRENEVKEEEEAREGKREEREEGSF